MTEKPFYEHSHTYIQDTLDQLEYCIDKFNRHIETGSRSTCPLLYNLSHLSSPQNRNSIISTTT